MLDKIAEPALGALVGALVTAWFQSVAVGHRITRLETLVTAIAAKVGIQT
jgi:hypothetical protein